MCVHRRRVFTVDPKLFMVLQALKDEDLKEVKWYVVRRLAKSAEGSPHATPTMM